MRPYRALKNSLGNWHNPAQYSEPAAERKERSLGVCFLKNCCQKIRLFMQVLIPREEGLWNQKWKNCSQQINTEFTVARGGGASRGGPERTDVCEGVMREPCFLWGLVTGFIFLVQRDYLQSAFGKGVNPVTTNRGCSADPSCISHQIALLLTCQWSLGHRVLSSGTRLWKSLRQ